MGHTIIYIFRYTHTSGLCSKSHFFFLLTVTAAALTKYCCMQYAFNRDRLLYHNSAPWTLTLLLISAAQSIEGKVTREACWLASCKMWPGAVEHLDMFGIQHTMYREYVIRFRKKKLLEHKAHFLGFWSRLVIFSSKWSFCSCPRDGSVIMHPQCEISVK